MVTPNSPDITSLQVDVYWDISGSNPLINLVNNSTGTNLANVSYGFLIKSPSGTVIHNGNVSSPDISGVWSAFTFYTVNPDPNLSPPPSNYIVAPWPRPFNQIEWSGADYTLEVFAKDSIGNIFSYVVSQAICRPAGNTNLSVNTYGKGLVNITLNCNNANAFFENITNTSYKGISGTQQNSVLKVLYPNDQTDTAPQPFIINDFSSALVPITYDSENYEFVYTSVFQYSFPNGSFVIIKYYTKKRFSVICNIDLCPLVCEYVKLLNQSETGNCSNLQEINEKLILINGKLNLALLAKTQPMCGIDLPALIEEIKVIGGFNCDCCSPSGIQPLNSANLADYNFIVNTGCGDITGYASVVGNNVTFTLSDKSYIFKMCSDVPTTAFTVTPSIAGCTKTYCLNVNLTTFATDILNTIKGNTELVTLFNSIVNIGTGNFQLTVDGDCIFTSSAVCDFTFGLVNIPADTISGNCLLTGIAAAGVPLPLNYSFDLNSLPALQAYINTLGLGTCVVTDLGSGSVRIAFAGNTHQLQQLTYKTNSSNTIANFTSNCTGFAPLSANQVVQAIINYLCDIDDSQMVTSQDYEICYVDPASNLKVIKTIDKGTAENLFLSELLDRNCDTVDYIMALQKLNCINLKLLFPYSPDILQLNDFIFGTKGGLCAAINPVELGTRIFQLGIFNADFMNAVCLAVAACAGGKACEPYTVFQIEVVEGSPTGLMNIVVTFIHPTATAETIRYARIDNTNNPVYTTIVPNTLPGASPLTISGLPDGQYIVGITPVYSDGRRCGETFLTTPPCSGITGFSGIFNGSGNIVISYTAEESMEAIKIVVNYPNGGTASSVHTNTGTDITITPPAGVYGEFSITGIPVCRISSGFFGQPTAPVILNVTPANQSSFTNNTTNTVAPVSMSAKSATVGLITPLFTSPSVAVSGIVNFYIPDDTYGNINITWGTGIVGAAFLTTTSGVYNAVIIGNQASFSDVVVSGGITVTIVDSSPES